MNLEQINAWTDDEARESFTRCCGSTRWSEEMARRRPFESEAALFETAERIWWGLSTADWLEAFAAHPRIGDMDALASEVRRDRRLGEPRTGGRLGASEDVLRELADVNRRYEERFGYIFIVCATGKTAEEMLELLAAAALQRPRRRDQARRRRADEDHADSPGKDRPMSPITTHVLDTAPASPRRASPSSSRSGKAPTAGPSWPVASPTTTAGSVNSPRRSAPLEARSLPAPVLHRRLLHGRGSPRVLSRGRCDRPDRRPGPALSHPPALEPVRLHHLSRQLMRRRPAVHRDLIDDSGDSRPNERNPYGSNSSSRADRSQESDPSIFEPGGKMARIQLDG